MIRFLPKTKSPAPLPIKKSHRSHREKKVLLELVDLYIHANKPIGSNTLKEKEFEDLSSATIRNYFAHLEKEGYLMQPHSSGGRVPTDKAFQYYAQHYLSENQLSKETLKKLSLFFKKETPQISEWLRKTADQLSEWIHCPIFLSEPALEMDFIQNIQFFALDSFKFVAVLTTHYGLTHTEVLFSPQPFTAKELIYLQAYFYWRLGKKEKPQGDEKLLKWAQRLYNELIFRHLILRSSTALYSTGISKLLQYPECNEATSLVQALSLFEDPQTMQTLLQTCLKKQDLSFWIGTELTPYFSQAQSFCVIAVPYKIGQTGVGAVALLAPMRVPYRFLFPILRKFSELLTQWLTRNIYKYKIPFKKEKVSSGDFKDGTPAILLENKG